VEDYCIEGGNAQIAQSARRRSRKPKPEAQTRRNSSRFLGGAREAETISWIGQCGLEVIHFFAGDPPYYGAVDG